VSKEEVLKKISAQVEGSPIVLYVKGSPQMPQCGFSKAVMDIFDHLGAEYQTVDVLSDPDIREGIKEFTQWPTIPQIFINGEFVGGCDIVRDLFQNGELEKMVKATQPAK
jgi:monothiol glutaredoxin